MAERRFTNNIYRTENITYSSGRLAGQRSQKSEYRRGRFRIVEGEIVNMIPSREALVSEIDYLSRLKNLHSRQIDLLKGILECDSVTDKGIEYNLYREFHELRVLLDQLRLSGSPTLAEHSRGKK